MPLPKRRHSNTRTNKRRTHWKISVPNVEACPRCHEAKLPHQVCPACGFYNGRLVIAQKEKKEQ
jgi:large subunit ribosomal protein L32